MTRIPRIGQRRAATKPKAISDNHQRYPRNPRFEFCEDEGGDEGTRRHFLWRMSAQVTVLRPACLEA